MTRKEIDLDKTDKISLGDLRDLLIIAGIFLFFTGWIYIYYFYDYFGISLSLVSIDYSTFIVYSFIVLMSYYGLPLFGIMALIIVYRKWLRKYITLTVFVALLLFPGLYVLAKGVANQKAVDLRTSPNSMRHISFVFKDDAGFLAYKFDNDSLPFKNPLVEADLSILKDTGIPDQLYLLGQNQEYFFVLYQPSAIHEIKGLPFGSIYFIDKNNVLYSKITITSNKKMKPLNKLLIAFLPVIIIINMLGCNNKPKGNTTPVAEVNKTDSSIVIASTNVNAGAGTETTSIPVYAISVSKKQGNRTYDGLYDSTSGYIRLCESKQLYHIDDRSEIAINASNNCFNMGTAVRMIIIRRDSAAPLFLSVLHVDSMGKNLVGLTDNNDTIMTSVSTMNRDAFEKLKMEYRVSNFKQIEIDKIKQYYLPEMKRQNMEKKERIMKASAVIKR